MISWIRKRKWTLISLAFIVPLGFFTKLYRGPFQLWFNNSCAGGLYIIFWSLCVFLFFRKTKISKIILIVLTATSVLEILQLWHPVPLELLRSNFLGRTVLGTTFSWSDFLYYGMGSIVAFWWLNQLQKYEKDSYQF